MRTIYSQICVNFKIPGKDGDERAKEEYTKIKKGKLEHSNTRPSSPKLVASRGSRPSELSHVQARSHLIQVQLC